MLSEVRVGSDTVPELRDLGAEANQAPIGLECEQVDIAPSLAVVEELNGHAEHHLVVTDEPADGSQVEADVPDGEVLGPVSEGPVVLANQVCLAVAIRLVGNEWGHKHVHTLNQRSLQEILIVLSLSVAEHLLI